jgi:colanic acid/amylovoran biosynthesis protein
MTMSAAGMRFLVVNQHGENRGDEAAMRAMVRAIDARFPGSIFTVLTQFRDRDLQIRFEAQDVTLTTMMLPLREALLLAAYAVCGTLGVRPAFLLSGRARAIVQAYEAADIVITAPGGPYFGDIYADHELVHWFYVYLARLHGKPVFQYAPSCGPFRIAPMNWLRRRFYRWIDVLVVREEISRDALQNLLGPSRPVHLTTDAAIQDPVRPASREEYFTGSCTSLRERFLVAVTLQRYSFADDPNPAARRLAYEQALLACLEHLAGRMPVHFLFFPQLYGAVHTDVPFHHYMAGRLSAGISWEIVNPGFDSDRQRALFGMTDFCVASRYHPQIFATAHAIPGLFVWYEHKQVGHLKRLGLETFAFDIRRLDVASMLKALDEALDQRAELSARLAEQMPGLQRLSSRTTDLLDEFVRSAISAAHVRPAAGAARA